MFRTKAAAFLKEIIEKENALAVRIYTGGGGCCKWLEMAPVNHPLSGDVTYVQDGITVFIEKGLVSDGETIEITLDEKNGLHIEIKNTKRKK